MDKPVEEYNVDDLTVRCTRTNPPTCVVIDIQTTTTPDGTLGVGSGPEIKKTLVALTAGQKTAEEIKTFYSGKTNKITKLPTASADAEANTAKAAEAAVSPTLSLKVNTDENKRIVINDSTFSTSIRKDFINLTNAPISWDSSNTAAATVDSKGVVTVTKSDLIVPDPPVTITASVGPNDTQKVVFTLVNEEATKMLTPTLERIGDKSVLTQTIKGNKQMHDLTPFITVPSGVVPKWESSDVKIATVNYEGNVISEKPGETNVTAYVGNTVDNSSDTQKVIFKIIVEPEEQFGGRRRSKGTVRQKLGKLRRRMGTRAKKQ